MLARLLKQRDPFDTAIAAVVLFLGEANIVLE